MSSMPSAEPSSEQGSAPTSSSGNAALDDRSTAARIRDAAIEAFAERGVAATPVRDVARRAGVSPGLVIHHFGSKDELRVACDEHVATMVRARKSAAMRQGAGLDVLEALRDSGEGPPLLAYLAATITDGSPHVADLVDEFVEDAVGYMQEGIDAGVLRPVDDLRSTAAVLTLWSLGAVVLHEHAGRLLGADLLTGGDRSLPYVRAALELFAGGILSPEAGRSLRAQLPLSPDGEPTPPHPEPGVRP